MFQKLDFIQEKYDELSMKVSDPEIIANQTLWQKLAKEMGEMEPVVKKYGEYKKAKEGNRYVYKIGIASPIANYSYPTAIGLFQSLVGMFMIILANTFAKRIGEESLW